MIFVLLFFFDFENELHALAQKNILQAENYKSFRKDMVIMPRMNAPRSCCHWGSVT